MPDQAERLVRVRGRGVVEIAAYGLADAEHQVEKEIRRAWPEARVEVLEVARARAESRIVEEFSVTYRITADVRLPPGSDQKLPAAAFRLARALLEGTRFRRTEWMKG